MISKQVRVTSPSHPDCVAVDLLWDEDYPMDFGITFIHECGREVTWALGREFFVEGLKGQGSHGEGDVKIRDSGHGPVALTVFPNEEDPAVVFIPRQPLKSFLETTLKVVPLESEDYESVVDEILEDILG